MTRVHRSAIHDSAQQGYSVEARTYAQGRPDYPVALLSWLQEDLNIKGGNVIELGAGTGKFTALLAQTGADITAIEPVVAMRDQFSQRLPDIPVIAGTADAIPLHTASADAVVCAQSFHWFANETVLAEIHRVLKPGGRLGLIWNVRDESVDWVSAITEIIKPYESGTPRFYQGEWREAFSGRYFDAPQQTIFAYQHSGTPQEVIINRTLSVSFIAALPAAEKARVADRLQAFIASHPALTKQANIAFPYHTHAYRCNRVDA